MRLLPARKYILVLFSVLVLFCQNSYSAQFEISLNEQGKNILLNYSRLLLEDKDVSGIRFDDETNQISTPLIICLFSKDGELLISERVENKNVSIEKKIREAVQNIKHTLKLNQNDLKNSYIHILVQNYEAKFANFGIKGLFDWKVYEPRVTGLVYYLSEKRAELNPLECLTWNFNSKKSRTYLAKKIKISPKAMIKQNDLEIGIYRVIHFGEGYPNRNLTNYHRGHKVFTIDQVNADTIRNSLQWIGNWYKNNTLGGEVAYQYDPTTGKYHNKNRTMVRSIMSVWSLNKLAYFLDDDVLKSLGKTCIDYYLQRYFSIENSRKQNRLIPSEVPTEKGETAANRYTTASFLAMAILERDDGQIAYKNQIKLLMDWVMQYQKPNGIFWTQYAQSQYFMPGQLLLAITTLYEKSKDNYYKKFFDKSFTVYSRQIEEMMHLAPKWYTPIAPAWFTQPFAKMYTITNEDKYKRIVFQINDRVEKWYYVNAENISYFDYDGILCPKPGSYGNLSITAASLESLVDAYHIAELAGNMEKKKKYKNVIKHTTAYLMRLQYLPENTYYIKNREKVSGGFKYDLVNNSIWMDNIWHLTNAFIKIKNYKILDN